MARIKVDLPDHFQYATRIPIRITDLNYGGHVGNDAVLGILHEARLQYLGQWGYTELKLAGVGLIMSDVVLAFRGESFYGDTLAIQITATEFTRVGFTFIYLVETQREGRNVLIAEARTGMICYDYKARRPVTVPPIFVHQVAALG